MDKLGVWDEQIQTTAYNISNQQYIVEHGELQSLSCNNLQWNIVCKNPE